MKALGILIVIPLFIIGGAILSGAFLYLGWNHGMIHMVPSVFKEITFFEAMWASVAFWSIGSAFRTTVKTKED